MVSPADLTPAQRVEFRRWRSLGLSEESSLHAMCQERGVEVSEGDQRAQLFESLGMTANAAKIAARGRDGDDPTTTSTAPAYFSEGARQALEALNSMSDAEVAAMAADHRRQAIAEAKKRKPAKSQAGTRRTIQIQEPGSLGRILAWQDTAGQWHGPRSAGK